jgi:acyl-CoA thioester hydrolase
VTDEPTAIASPGEHRRLHVPIHLRWGDLDAFNHVNNASMLKLLEEVRVRAFWRPAADEDAPPTAVLDSGIDAGTLTLIARQEIEYLRPVPYQRNPLDVQLWFGKLGGSSIEVCYEVFSPQSSVRAGVSKRGAPGEQELYARASAVVVMVDAATGRPVRLTDEQRSAWSPYLGDPVVYAHRR